ncbi:hypothetical protein Acr_00g0024160 [Actinidia rufa]|uniref:Uncharacterized protein n=1 Tax=Actinidia rufa TaxID=165716 RepID=A0A7J0DD14_9ERIC|nr:hypothetical protein Acr_00g0024160 [Actinidia rufa]
MEIGGSSKKSKSKRKESWTMMLLVSLARVRKSSIIKSGFGMAWGWIDLTKFKAESALTLCQEFMANIKYNPEIEKEENPEFEFSDVGMPDLAMVSQELLLEGDEWDGKAQCNKTCLKDKYLVLVLFLCHSLLPLNHTMSMNTTMAKLVWAIGMGKTIDLPRMMFLSLCVAYTASDKRGSVHFTGFLTELFKRSGVHIPLDITGIEPKGAIDRSSLSRSEGQSKKRKLEETAHEESPMGMAELKEAIMGRKMGAQMSEFKAEMIARVTSLEEESRRQVEYDDEEEEEEEED